MAEESPAAPAAVIESPFGKAFKEAESKSREETSQVEKQAVAAVEAQPKQPARHEQKPTNEQKVEAQPEDMPAEIKSEAGKKSWQKYKEETAAKIAEFEKQTSSVRSELEKATKALEEARKNAVDPAEIERLRKEKADIQKEKEDLYTRLRLKDIQEDPSWRADIEVPRQTALQDAKSNVPKEIRSHLERLMAEPPSDERNDAIEELVRDLSPLKQTNVAMAVRQHDAVLKKQEALLSNHKTLVSEYDQFQQNRTRSEQERAQKELETTVDSILAAASDPVKGMGVFQPTDSKDESKQQALERVRLAREMAMADPTPRNRANMAAWAVQGQQSIPLLNAAREEIVRLQAQLKKFESGSPSIASSGQSTSDQSASSEARPKGFMDAFKRAFNPSAG